MERDGITSDHLTPESRDMWAWFTYFSNRDHFDAYRSAIGRAKSIMEDAVVASGRSNGPVLIHFRPTTVLYRFRTLRDRTRLDLPTPMIGFDNGGFSALARLAFRDGQAKREIMELMQTEPCVSIHRDLQRLATAEGRSAGAFHDLAGSFHRVNAEYFGGQMSAPHLSWSRRLTGMRFGKYDPAGDAITVSSTLDSADVPQFLIDFIIYHELLHKKIGVRCRNGRQAAHTPEFRREERRFQRFAEVKALLVNLAKRHA